MVIDSDTELEITTPTPASKRYKSEGLSTCEKAIDFKLAFKEGLTDKEILGKFLYIHSW